MPAEADPPREAQVSPEFPYKSRLFRAHPLFRAKPPCMVNAFHNDVGDSRYRRRRVCILAPAVGMFCLIGCRR